MGSKRIKHRRQFHQIILRKTTFIKAMGRDGTRQDIGQDKTGCRTGRDRIYDRMGQAIGRDGTRQDPIIKLV